MYPEQFELTLVRSKDDASAFSAEYQVELSQFSRQAHATSQRGFAMDSVGGGGGSLGEFIFNNAGALITALTTICVTWLGGRLGRKLRLEVGNTVIEARTMEEIKVMVEHVRVLQAQQCSSEETHQNGEK